MIARDRLTSCLLKEVQDKHPDAITVRFGVDCADVEWLEATGGTGVTLTLVPSSPSPSPLPSSSSDGEKLSAEFVVAADGVKSTVRDEMERDTTLVKELSGSVLRVKRFPRSNEFVYKVIAFELDPTWRCGGGCSRLVWLFVPYDIRGVCLAVRQGCLRRVTNGSSRY